MSISFLNRVRVNITSTGQGDLICGTANSSDALTLIEANAVDGNIYTYILSEGNNFELGWGIYSSASNSLTRNVRLSKVGGIVGTTKITLIGTGVLGIDVLAEDLINFSQIPRQNRIENSGMGLCSVLLPTRVGNPVAISGYSTYGGTGSGIVALNCPSGPGGIIAEKLFLVEGATAPHVPHVAVSLTVTLNKRMTGPAGTFAGIVVGNWFRLTGGSTNSRRLDYKIIATDGSTYVETSGGPSGSILVNETATFNLTWYAGPAAVDPTVNGYTANPIPYFEAQPGCSLQAIDTNSNTIYATLSGWYSDALNSSAAIAWEIVPADTGYDNTEACDTWRKSYSLKYWRTCEKDWDGVTPTTLPGAMYGAKLQKGSTGIEKFWKPMCQKGGAYRDIVNPALLRKYRGKKFSFNMEWRVPSANTVRLYIYDGLTYTYSDYFVPTGNNNFDFKEVTANISKLATNFILGIEINGNGNLTDYYYCTQPMGDFGGPIGRGNYVPFKGRVFPTFHQHPVKFVNTGDINFDRPIRIEQETNGIVPRDCLAVVLDLEGATRNPSSIVLEDSPQTYVPTCVLIVQVASGVGHVPGTLPLGQVEINIPSGTFVSENWWLHPNSVGDWFGMTIDMVAYDFG